MESFGGQMVTMGKSRSSMEWVVIEVAMGFSCHSLYDLAIRIPAVINPIQTIENQRIFADLDWNKTNDEKRKSLTKTYLR